MSGNITTEFTPLAALRESVGATNGQGANMDCSALGQAFECVDKSKESQNNCDPFDDFDDDVSDFPTLWLFTSFFGVGCGLAMGIYLLFSPANFSTNRKPEINQVSQHQQYGNQGKTGSVYLEIDGERFRVCHDDKDVDGNNANPQGVSDMIQVSFALKKLEQFLGSFFDLFFVRFFSHGESPLTTELTPLHRDARRAAR